MAEKTTAGEKQGAQFVPVTTTGNTKGFVAQVDGFNEIQQVKRDLQSAGATPNPITTEDGSFVTVREDRRGKIKEAGYEIVEDGSLDHPKYTRALEAAQTRGETGGKEDWLNEINRPKGGAGGGVGGGL